MVTLKLGWYVRGIAFIAISLYALTPAEAQVGGLVVTITSPSVGSTVSGVVTVSASVTGGLRVNNVQFRLDGAQLGLTVAKPPYAVSWDTIPASAGSHTLTAVARASGGLTFTSNPVKVTVSNAAPPPAPSSTRFEEDSPSVSYSSGWDQGDKSQTWSGGTAAFSGGAGAQASFTFTGPSVTWIGGRDSNAGIARVSVDGVFLRNIDTYSKTREVRVSMFQAIDLANTSHTLTIEVTGQQNAAASGNLIVIDAFDVPALPVSRLQETDPDVSFSVGNWALTDVSRPWSAGFAALTDVPNAQVTFTFTGSGVTWIGARGPQTGMANVLLDGVPVATNLDTYAPAEQIQAAMYTTTGLSDTNHTLTIVVTGQRNAAATGSLVVVDGFEVTMSGVRHQETDPEVAYGPGWLQEIRDKAYSEGAEAESETTGAQAAITFNGTGIRWIGARGPQTGIVRISLDGAVVEDLDTYFPTEGPQHADFFTSGLARGLHTLTVEVLGKNPISTNAWILIDAYDVIP